LTAISISASSKTMNGALPPNSRESFLTVPAHCSISNLPTSVEPVKVSLRTVGFDVSWPDREKRRSGAQRDGTSSCMIPEAMNGNELYRRLQKIGKERGVEVSFESERGRGSHGTVRFGDRFTVMKDRRKEIRPGLLHAMLRQLGLTERDLN
jgi:mRNA interferase HicA